MTEATVGRGEAQRRRYQDVVLARVTLAVARGAVRQAQRRLCVAEREERAARSAYRETLGLGVREVVE